MTSLTVWFMDGSAENFHCPDGLSLAELLNLREDAYGLALAFNTTDGLVFIPADRVKYAEWRQVFEQP